MMDQGEVIQLPLTRDDEQKRGRIFCVPIEWRRKEKKIKGLSSDHPFRSWG